MKCYLLLIYICLLSFTKVMGQPSELQLAQQYKQSGELQKALDIFQRLYKQNEAYYNDYINCLTDFKKFDDAESITKKAIRKHPEDNQYPIMLGRIYTLAGHTDKANNVYEGLLKHLPDSQTGIAILATQLYQAESFDYAIKILQQGRKQLHNDDAFTSELISLYRIKRDKIGLTEEYLNLLPVNPAFLIQAQNTLSALYDGEADYDMLRTALLKRLQKDPQQVVYTALLTWQYLQQKQYNQALTQTIALSKRQNNNGSDIYDLCRTLVDNQAYDEAIRGYEYILSHYKKTDEIYIPTRIDLLDARSSKITSGKYQIPDLLSLEKDYTDLLNEFGRRAGTAFAMQQLARLQAFKLHKFDAAQKLLEETVGLPGMKPQLLAACKLDLGDVYLMNSQPWEATLVYSQVEKAYPGTALAQEANYRNAKLAYYTGDFAWAKNQLNILKAATSQLIANDALNLSLLINDNTQIDSAGLALKMYARADLLIFKEEPGKTLLTLDSIDKNYPANTLKDDILMAKARIFLQQKNFDQALVLLKEIVSSYPAGLWADDAVYMLGNIYEEQLHNNAEAKIWYQKIITDYPGSIWLGEARKHFRLLRGDKSDSSS